MFGLEGLRGSRVNMPPQGELVWGWCPGLALWFTAPRLSHHTSHPPAMCPPCNHLSVSPWLSSSCVPGSAPGNGLRTRRAEGAATNFAQG